MVLYWSRIMCMHRWVTNYVLVIWRRHTSHTKWSACCRYGYALLVYVYELGVCVDALRTMFLWFQRKHTSHTEMECMLQMQVRAGAVLVANYVFASMHYELCVPVISKRTSTSAEMQCKPQTKLSALGLSITNYVYASISYELCTCHVQGNTRHTRKWSACCRYGYALCVLITNCVYVSMGYELCTCYFKGNTHHTQKWSAYFRCGYALLVYESQIVCMRRGVTNWSTSVCAQKKTDELRAHESQTAWVTDYANELRQWIESRTI